MNRMWLAHAMTLIRLPLAALFWLVAGDARWAIAVVAAAAVTDALDGRLARRALRRGATGTIAHIGTWLDPLCDKLFAVAVLVALAVRLDVPLRLLALVATRDILVIPLVALYHVVPPDRRAHHELRASRAGKLTTAAQFAAIIAFLLEPPATAMLAIAIATAALGLVTALGYIRAARNWRTQPQ
jgi:cardiolipin synthase (CMP-forming)